MMQIKRPAVAGFFYPGSAGALRSAVQNYLGSAHNESTDQPVALIAPHAGYPYSGPIAGSAYATLLPWADAIQRVAVFAPSHRVPFEGIAISSADYFQTPLGDIEVGRDAVATIANLHGVIELNAAFAQEHALEVQLPFLQVVLKRFTLVPLIVGEADSDDVLRIMETLAGPDTLILVSSDLSHYDDYATCNERDRATSAAIQALRDSDIGPHDACGAYPMRGLLKMAQRHGWRVQILDLRNSGDTGGDHDRVVGYGAYAFY
jgi:AmmeMemoRadiSam system protein B